MSLKTLLFYFQVFIPIFIISFSFATISSTYVSIKVESTYENQMQLLNSVHFYLSKINAQDYNEKIKELFVQEGLNNLVIADTSGKIRYADMVETLGRSLDDVYGESVLNRIVSQSTQEGAFETTAVSHQPILLSYFKIELGDQRMILLLTKDKNIVTRALTIFRNKLFATVAALFFVYFISLIIINRYFPKFTLNKNSEILKTQS